MCKPTFQPKLYTILYHPKDGNITLSCTIQKRETFAVFIQLYPFAEKLTVLNCIQKFMGITNQLYGSR